MRLQRGSPAVPWSGRESTTHVVHLDLAQRDPPVECSSPLHELRNGLDAYVGRQKPLAPLIVQCDHHLAIRYQRALHVVFPWLGSMRLDLSSVSRTVLASSSAFSAIEWMLTGASPSSASGAFLARCCSGPNRASFCGTALPVPLDATLRAAFGLGQRAKAAPRWCARWGPGAPPHAEAPRTLLQRRCRHRRGASGPWRDGLIGWQPRSVPPRRRSACERRG